MTLDDITRLAAGPAGGVTLLGVIIGGLVTHKFISPLVYNPKIRALEDRVLALEEEVKPYRDFKDQQALEAMQPRRLV